MNGITPRDLLNRLQPAVVGRRDLVTKTTVTITETYRIRQRRGHRLMAPYSHSPAP